MVVARELTADRLAGLHLPGHFLGQLSNVRLCRCRGLFKQGQRAAVMAMAMAAVEVSGSRSGGYGRDERQYSDGHPAPHLYKYFHGTTIKHGAACVMTRCAPFS